MRDTQAMRAMFPDKPRVWCRQGLLGCIYGLGVVGGETVEFFFYCYQYSEQSGIFFSFFGQKREESCLASMMLGFL